jgi:hypothetical protein
MRRVAFASACLTLGLVPAIASAEGPPPSGSAAYVHDGVYLRVAGGFSALQQSVMRSSFSQLGSVSGLATSSELAIGTTMGPVVVGVGAYTVAGLLTQTRTRGAEPLPSNASGLPSLAVVGPFLDRYLDPTKGLHVQLALGFALLSDASRDDSPLQAVGGGFVVGAGYEWWVSEQWSAGVLARSTMALTTGRDEGVRHVQWTTAGPEVLLSLTGH